MNKSCPLCESEDIVKYKQTKDRKYSTCRNCSLVFVDKSYLLDAKSEKKRYDKHTNDSEDKNYRKYLRKVLDPVVLRLKPKAKGLDFGSGPGPTLHKMFEESGFEMNIYDHFYAKDEEVLTKKYDFITMTEVIEHLYKPKEVLEQLLELLKTDAILCLMTQLYPEDENFDKWYYKNDPTHVSLFSKKTMAFIAKKYDLDLTFIDKDIFIFKKINK